MPAARKKIAIACQGGGSHAAFAAGVLRRLLAADLRERYTLVGLSGTSGGAMCAALAWAGLLAGGADDAIRRLTAFWDEMKAADAADAIVNLWGVLALRSAVTAEFSPYLYRTLAEERLEALVARHVCLAGLPLARRERFPVKLLVGATDVLSGERVVFGGTVLTDRHLIASAAVPPLFRAVDIGGRLYWDGLFTCNPPVREFTDESVLPQRPDEIWVVQINPQRQAAVPQAIGDIVDRRNELSGNLALAQELYFIERMNALTARMAKCPQLPWPYRPIAVKVVEMPLAGLDYPSKLDRSPAFVERLVEAGLREGARFLDDDAPGLDACSLPLASRCIV